MPFPVCAAVAFARNVGIVFAIVLVGAVDSTDPTGAPVLLAVVAAFCCCLLVGRISWDAQELDQSMAWAWEMLPWQ